MKKVMIAFAAVALAMSAQAASFNWTSTGLATTRNIYASDGSTLLYTANSAAVLYLFDAAVVSQDTLLAGLRGDKSISDFTAVANQTIASNSRVSAQTVEYGTAGTTYNFYLAVVDGDNVFLGANVTSAAQASDTSDIAVNGLTSATKKSYGETATFGTSGAGWYQTVPEPTSGLLMLVGLGALALRRRRA